MFRIRYLLSPLEEKREAESGGGNPPGQTGKVPLGWKSWEAGQITMPQFKQKLTGFFTAHKQKPSSALSEEKKSRGRGEDWGDDSMLRERAEFSEDCRQAFTTTCQLLLECTTFPVYLSEEETEALYAAIFQEVGKDQPL